jgi:outer membrane immunogenic protein
MKKFLTATAALVSLALGAPAFAADLPVKAAPPVMPALYNWNGFYIGVQGGAISGTRSKVFEAENDDPLDFEDFGHPLHGGFVGGEVGFNWQAPGSRWVFGVEGAGSWSELEESLTCAVDRDDTSDLHRFCGSRVRDFFEARGRIGYAFGPTGQFLAFITGGGVWARESERFNNSFTSTAPGGGCAAATPCTGFGTFEQWANVPGWTVGGGAEWGITPWLSLKGEVLYINLNQHTFNTAGCGVVHLPNGAASDICDDGLRIKHEFVAARLALNWRFGFWGVGKGKAPVVASY